MEPLTGRWRTLLRDTEIGYPVQDAMAGTALAAERPE
jgi:hypothetical protein